VVAAKEDVSFTMSGMSADKKRFAARFTIRFVLSIFLSLLFISCAEPNVGQAIRTRAAGKSSVVLCDVDASGEFVRYIAKDVWRASGSTFTIGQTIVRGPKVERGTDYGREVVVFFSGAKPDLVVALRDGRVPDAGLTREEIIKLVKAQTP
jgi:hypothetical protein